MLAQRVNFSTKWAAAPVSIKRSVCCRKVVAKGDTQVALVGEEGDYAPGIAAGLFVAIKQGAFAASADKLRTFIAIGAIALPVVNTLLKKDYGTIDLRSLAPAALAAEALNVGSITTAACAAWGTTLAAPVADVLGFNGAYYLALASFAASVYYNVASVWIAGALLLTQGWSFIKNAKESKFFGVPLAISLAAIYALVRYFKDGCSTCVGELAAAVVFSKIALALVDIGRDIVRKESD